MKRRLGLWIFGGGSLLTAIVIVGIAIKWNSTFQDAYIRVVGSNNFLIIGLHGDLCVTSRDMDVVSVNAEELLFEGVKECKITTFFEDTTLRVIDAPLPTKTPRPCCSLRVKIPKPTTMVHYPSDPSGMKIPTLHIYAPLQIVLDLKVSREVFRHDGFVSYLHGQPDLIVSRGCYLQSFDIKSVDSTVLPSLPSDLSQSRFTMCYGYGKIELTSWGPAKPLEDELIAYMTGKPVVNPGPDCWRIWFPSDSSNSYCYLKRESFAKVHVTHTGWFGSYPSSNGGMEFHGMGVVHILPEASFGISFRNVKDSLQAEIVTESDSITLFATMISSNQDSCLLVVESDKEQSYLINECDLFYILGWLYLNATVVNGTMEFRLSGKASSVVLNEKQLLLSKLETSKGYLALGGGIAVVFFALVGFLGNLFFVWSAKSDSLQKAPKTSRSRKQKEPIVKKPKPIKPSLNLKSKRNRNLRQSRTR